MSLADDAARLAARNYVGIDPEDISANIMEIVCRRPDRIERHREHRGWLWSVFYAEAIRYCNQQVRCFMYYSSEYFYTPQEVRELLERAFTTDIREDESIHISEATLGLIDLQRAFDKLKFHEKDLIVRKLKYREKLSDADRKAFYRATERLASILNRGIEEESKARVNHDGPGSRDVLSNAKAMEMTGSTWDG